MTSASPTERRALGYRWEDGAWKIEPTMAHGAFGAMGGIQTSATDYARWIAFLLSAWPPRDGTDSGPVRRSSVRELSQGANFPSLRLRPGSSGPDACREAATYAMGFYAASDCDLGLTLSHGGGYPGYGSHVLLLPEYGVGIFALANRTVCRTARTGVGRSGHAPPGRPIEAAADSSIDGTQGCILGDYPDVRGWLGSGCRRCVRGEFPDGSRRRPPGARNGRPQSGSWRV